MKLFDWRWFQHARETPLGVAERLVLLPSDFRMAGYIPVDIDPAKAIASGEGVLPFSTDRNACGSVIGWAGDHGIYVNIYHCLGLEVTCKCWHHGNPEIQTIASDHDESAAVCKAVLLCAAELDTP